VTQEQSFKEQSFSEQSWLWRDEQTKLTWVFGMRWLPALGSKGKRHLYRNLRQQGLGWAVTHGRALSLVGVQAQPNTAKLQRQQASAAVAFAHAHPQGVHALCLQISEVGVWLVAAAQGCVLSETDRWFETLEQAQLALQTLRERHDPMSYEELLWSPHDSACEAATTPSFLRGAKGKACQFQKLPSGQSAWPLVAAFGCLGLAALLVVHRLWIDPVRPDRSAVAVAPEAKEPVSVKVHGALALRTLFEAWQQLPVDPAGWLLQGVRCRVDGGSADCTAAYKRDHPGADNNGLAKHVPKHWRFTPQSLDLANYRRRLSMPLQSLDMARLAREGAGLTQLQQLSAKLATVSVAAAHQMTTPGTTPLVPSSIDAATPISRQPALERALSVRLSLRQSHVLIEPRLPVRWQQVDLLLVQGAQIDERHGYLMANLQGRWIAQAERASSLSAAADVPTDQTTTALDPLVQTHGANLEGENLETEYDMH